MSSFHDISFEPPGYPIYRAFIIPYRRNKELRDVVEIGAKEIESWREMLENLRSFLLNAIESLAERDIDLTDHEKLELTGDLISLFLRIPLNREVLPSVSPSPLKAYILMRLMKLEELFKEWEFDPIQFTHTFYDARLRKYLREEKQYPKLSKILRDLETTEVSDLLESCWLLIPADTRPALNTASLVSHLLLTSAITWSMAVNLGIKDRRIIARLRLAALLHDIGKLFKYRDHVRASAEIAERLLSELLPKEDIDFISECIKDHHDPKTEQGKVISEADKLASAIDRLKKLLDHDYFKDIKCKLEEAARALNYDSLERAFNDWNFWCRVYKEYDKELIRSSSEEFVRRTREITKIFTIIPSNIEKDESKAEPSGLRIVLIDVGGIQDFIYRSYSLRQVAAASLVIDSLVMAYIVAYLQWAISAKYWLPYETFLYTAGGNIELLIPRELVDDVKNEISRLNKCLIPKYGIPLHVVDAELYKNKIYSETVKELMAKMLLSKIHVGYKEYSAVIPSTAEKGVRNICQSCFMEPPVEKILTPEGEIAVCKTCYGFHEIGFNIHFMEKYESEISICGKIYRSKVVFNIPWDGEGPVKASERIMEIIAGHDGKELQELGKLAKMRNLAVIRVDGTLMGPLMATCLSIADAYERSARIDIALKKSIETAIKEICDGVSRGFGEIEAAKAALSIKMGILYAGGDDAVILAPSWASPLIALVLGKEFLYNLGCVRSLSIGVAAASPKANIWALVDASSDLMYKAKEGAREGIKNGSVESMLCFDIIEAGDLSSSTIEERFNTLKREKLTVQPFNMNDFEKMLCSILKLDYSKMEYSEIARLNYLASRNVDILDKYFKDSIGKDLIEQIRMRQDELKGIRHTIGETLQAAKSMIIRAGDIKQYERYIFPIAYIYACRQIARVGKFEKEQYEFVKSLIPDSLGSSSSLSDVDRLIKIIGGGVI